MTLEHFGSKSRCGGTESADSKARWSEFGVATSPTAGRSGALVGQRRSALGHLQSPKSFTQCGPPPFSGKGILSRIRTKRGDFHGAPPSPYGVLPPTLFLPPKGGVPALAGEGEGSLGEKQAGGFLPLGGGSIGAAEEGDPLEG